MTQTSVILTQTQIAHLRALFDERVDSDQSTEGLWAPVYEQLYQYLTALDSSSTTFEAVDQQTLLWLHGARFVNAGDGPFAVLIRDYTIIQHRLRYGYDATKAEMDTASNAIAKAFLGQWLGYDPDDPSQPPSGGTQPTIFDTGLFDAGPAAAGVFNKGPEGQDAAGWAGTLLFANLGAPEFWQRLVLDAMVAPQETGGYTSSDGSLTAADTGSYNAIAAAAALQEFDASAAAGSLFQSWDVFFGTLGGLWNQLEYADKVALLRVQTTAQLLELYGLSAVRGEPAPDVGTDIFGAFGSSIMLDVGKDAHYTVGSLGDDVIGYTPSANGAYVTDTGFWDRVFAGTGLGEAGDVVNAGRGNDTVYGSTGSDVLDGGEGENNLIYLPEAFAGPFSSLEFSFDGRGKFDSRTIVEKKSLLGAILGQHEDVAVQFDKLRIDWRSDQKDDPSTPSGLAESEDAPDAPWLEVDLTGPARKDGEILERSERVSLHGDLGKVRGADVTIDLGASYDVAFHQDEVDASQATAGIYFNLGSGSVVGLNQTTDRGLLGWIGTLAKVAFDKTDIQINGANSAIGTDYSDALIANGGAREAGEGFSALYGGGGNDLLGSKLIQGVEAGVVF